MRRKKGRCAECYGCQPATRNVLPPPVQPTLLPKRPWEEVAVDLTCPLPPGEQLHTNNCSNLVSKEVEEYLKEVGIEHYYTTPLWPRANGKVERQNRSLLKSIRAANTEEQNWTQELNKFLLAYRSMSHSTSGKSPTELLFRRRLKTKMPDLVDAEEEEIEVSDEGVCEQDTQRKQSNKEYVYKRLYMYARDRNMREGDTVLLEKKKEN